MQYHARLVDDVVVETFANADGVDFVGLYHPEIIAACRPCSAEVRQGWRLEGDALVAPALVLPSRERLLAYAADKRWRIEVGGIVIGGLTIKTDVNSQTKILGAYVAASRNPGWSTLWESVHPIDAATMIEIGDAVQAHINVSFATRATVYAAIEAGTITSFAAIDAEFV